MVDLLALRYRVPTDLQDTLWPNIWHDSSTQNPAVRAVKFDPPPRRTGLAERSRPRLGPMRGKLLKSMIGIRKGENLRNKETGQFYVVKRLQEDTVALESRNGE